MSHQLHLALGLIAIVLGLLVVAFGLQWFGHADAEVVAKGLGAVGAVAVMVSLVERHGASEARRVTRR